MFRKLAVLTLVTLLLQMTWVLPIAAATRRAQDNRTAKVKADVERYAGKNTKVSVTLDDGSKLKGRITQHDETSFTLTDTKNASSRSLNYADVEKVKSAGGLSTLAKIGIGIGVGVGALALTYVVAKANCNSFACP